MNDVGCGNAGLIGGAGEPAVVLRRVGEDGRDLLRRERQRAGARLRRQGEAVLVVGGVVRAVHVADAAACRSRRRRPTGRTGRSGTVKIFVVQVRPPSNDSATPTSEFVFVAYGFGRRQSRVPHVRPRDGEVLRVRRIRRHVAGAPGAEHGVLVGRVAEGGDGIVADAVEEIRDLEGPGDALPRSADRPARPHRRRGRSSCRASSGTRRRSSRLAATTGVEF